MNHQLQANAGRGTVRAHQAFRMTIATPPGFDDNDTDLDYLDKPAARRSEREVANLMEILDTLPPAREEMESEGRK